jgi:cysteinyl-tRNA synthetase
VSLVGDDSADARGLAEERARLRAARRFEEADRLRDRIRDLGFDVVDRPVGWELVRVVPASKTRVRPEEVPSVLDLPATADFSVHWLAGRWPEDVLRGIASFRKFESEPPVPHTVVETEVTPDTEWPPDVEVVALVGDPGFGEERNAQLRRSRGRVVIVADGSVEAAGDVFTPLRAALSDHSVGIVGPLGIVTDDLSEFREDEGPEVDAIESRLVAFRRELLLEGVAFDPRFRFYRNADIDFSFQVKALGLKALRVDVPIHRHEHRVWSTTPQQDRDRLSKRNFYRFLDRFRGRTDLLVNRRD